LHHVEVSLTRFGTLTQDVFLVIVLGISRGVIVHVENDMLPMLLRIVFCSMTPEFNRDNRVECPVKLHKGISRWEFPLCTLGRHLRIKVGKGELGRRAMLLQTIVACC
jgi:hypothetical protein